MAASVTHLVVGERVFAQGARALGIAPDSYGAFLAGCILVDVHAFHPIDRRRTHFVGRVDEDGANAYTRSCSNFLACLPTLLERPWGALAPGERAFVAGYLCHLAADECFKQDGERLLRELGIASWDEFPVPWDVSLTAFDYVSRGYLLDPKGTYAALRQLPVPGVFTHVPAEMFQHQWYVIEGYVLPGDVFETNTAMLVRAGFAPAKIEASRLRHAATRDASLALYERGMELARRCGAQLDRAELRIKELTPGADESVPEEDESDEEEGEE